MAQNGLVYGNSMIAVTAHILLPDICYTSTSFYTWIVAFML